MCAGVASPDAHVLKGRECRASPDAWVITRRKHPRLPLSREACGPDHGQPCLLPRCLRDSGEKGCRRDLGTNRVEVAHAGGVPVLQREVPLIVVATGDPRAVGLRGLYRSQVEEATSTCRPIPPRIVRSKSSILSSGLLFSPMNWWAMNPPLGPASARPCSIGGPRHRDTQDRCSDGGSVDN